MHRFADYVPEYRGDNSYESTTGYLESMFKSLYRLDRELFTHKTCATGSLLLLACPAEELTLVQIRAACLLYSRL